MSGNVKVTTLERTVIDCIDRIDRSGGTEELLQSIRSVQYLDENRLLEILEDYNKATLYKKTGFVTVKETDEEYIMVNNLIMC